MQLRPTYLTAKCIGACFLAAPGGNRPFVMRGAQSITGNEYAPRPGPEGAMAGR
jgi:hypothetical protein